MGANQQRHWLLDLINIEAKEVEGEEFPTPLIAAAYEAWHSWGSGDVLPSWNDAEMMDLPLSLIPYTVVVDVKLEPLDFVYRFWGTGMASHHDQELTGKSVADVRPIELSRVVRTSYEEVVGRAKPIVTIHRYVQDNGSLMDDYIIRLPISDNGRGVSKVMSVVDTPDKTYAYLNGIRQLFPSNN